MKRLALCSSFIPSDKTAVPNYIFYYLEQMRHHAQTLVYLYNEDFKLNETDKAKLLEIVDDIMPVKNEGYDFGMWQKGLRKYDANSYDELCLFNDSCVCIGSFDRFFEWHENENKFIDITSLTVSNELAKHLQSYFICVRKTAVQTISDWLLTINFPALDFPKVIVAGEIGLSLFAQHKKLKILGFYDLVTDCNPTLQLPLSMIVHNTPLIKKKVLLRNMNKEDNSDFVLTEVIKKYRNLDIDLCHQLFDWMPTYQLDNVTYQGG